MTVHLLQVYLPKTIPAHSRAGGRSDARGFNDRPKAVSHFEKRKSTNKRQFKRALTSEVAQDGSNGPDATPYDLGDNPLRSQFDYTIENGQRTKLTETFYFDDDGLSTTPDVAKTTTYDWDYDANDRLISETIDHHDDALDRTEHFIMDLFGNRLSRTVDYVDPTINDQFFEYTYDDNDRLISETLDTGNDGSVDQTTTYDWGQDDTVTPALLGGTQQLGKTVQDSSSNTVSTQTFSYNLQGRLASVVSTPSSGSATKVDYQYDSSGIRISSKQFTDSNANGQFEAGELDETVEYLIDHRNHTGYAQTIVETTKNSSDVITKRIAYTFGTDEITQTVTDYIAGVAQTPKVHTFGHDAHGSVRVLLDAAGAIAQAFTYAAYGELLAIHNATGASVTDANSPGLADDAKSSLLYSGEAFDSRIGQQYLRARWYDTAAGRFSRLDPYFGNIKDPLSFNKYNYTHSNPILGTDPTGMFFSVGGFLSSSTISTIGRGLNQAGVYAGRQAAFSALETGLEGVVAKTISSLFGVQNEFELGRSFATNFASNLLTGGLGKLPRLQKILQFAIRSVADVVAGERVAWAVATNLITLGTPALAKMGGKIFQKLAKVDSSKLVHLTDDAGLAGIRSSTSIKGAHGIFAIPSSVARQTTAIKVARSGLWPSRTEHAVPIPQKALDAFKRPVPVGPYSAWKFFGGVHTANPGVISTATGEFTEKSALIGPKVLVYGPDGVFYVGIATAAGLYTYAEVAANP